MRKGEERQWERGEKGGKGKKGKNLEKNGEEMRENGEKMEINGVKWGNKWWEIGKIGRKNSGKMADKMASNRQNGGQYGRQ